jgi:CRISPR/Cas system CSM-associated protein Csm3 (group 7 of RAMP superfamily)
MNPYDFVRINWNRGVTRRDPAPHNRFTGGLCGRIEGTITTLTPLFIPATLDLQQKEALQRGNRAIDFAHNSQRQPVIPGSSLKGLFRSLVETLGPGCWWLFDGSYKSRDGSATIRSDYSQKLPRSFRQCPQGGGLCVACRLFGLIKGRTLLLGKVGFEDAVCAAPEQHAAIYTPALDTPKARHAAWYLDAGGERVAGRKFYFHFADIAQERGPKQTRSGIWLNSLIEPLGPGSRFTFSATFDNVDADEWAVLLYALTLERTDWGHDRDVRHKLGYAKPAGLGSVAVELTRLTLVDYQQRYTAPDRGMTAYTGAALQDYVNEQIRPFRQDNSPTLLDLRRIWRWPPHPGVTYTYPGQDWFKEHPTAPIEETP